MGLSDNIGGIRVTKTTLSRLKSLFPKLCEHGQSMDVMINRMCKVCELLDGDELRSFISENRARTPRSANTK